ncbi:hypothetical protein HDR58_05480 [bacterium]|nr:hypothetical protein [bacterium]
MKKSEATALKTDSAETKRTVVLLTSVTDVKLGEAPKGKAIPKMEANQKSAPIIEPAPSKKPEGDSKEKAKPKAARKVKTESAPKVGEAPLKKPEGDSEEKAKPESAPIFEPAPSTKAAADSKSGDKVTDKKAGKVPKSKPKPDPVPEPPHSELLPTQPVPATNPSAVTPPVMAKKPPVSVVESPLKLMKQEFNRRSNCIREEMGNIQNSFVVIGFQLHWIKANNMYRVLDYKNICEYAEKEYNIKKSTCNNLISIIENFAERDENGEVIESIVECYRNYSSTQLLAMIGMPEELQEQVTPDMSVRAIQRLRKGEPEKPPVDAPRAVVTTVKEPEKDIPGKPFTAGPAAPAPITGANPSTEEAVSPAPVIRAETPPKEVTKGAEKAVPTEKDVPEEKAVPTEKPADAEKDTVKPNPVPHPANPAKPPEHAVQTKEVNGEDTVNLAEIDSYNAYKDMQEKIDVMIKHVFSGDRPVRVKIVCVHR